MYSSSTPSVVSFLWAQQDRAPTLVRKPKFVCNVLGKVLAIWKALAKRRAEEKNTQIQQARDAGMEYFQDTRTLNTSTSQTLGNSRQRAAFVLEVKIYSELFQRRFTVLPGASTLHDPSRTKSRAQHQYCPLARRNKRSFAA